ncbi:MAG: thioredoxin family protein [Planctomycetes bacterium]|jgi:small redox-active disulfide protein 2|nr:TM0996/MTH895 family glutaredoxin-like protein [Phycisphaerae bacterium]NBB95399.1 thioredoxin family protein [Planctomycetota bacterium]
MKDIKILGAGCPKCQTLMDLTTQAAEIAGLDYQIEKVTDVSKFAEYGVMITPALVVDGEVLTVGKVPPLEDIQSLLEQH